MGSACSDTNSSCVPQQQIFSRTCRPNRQSFLKDFACSGSSVKTAMCPCRYGYVTKDEGRTTGQEYKTVDEPDVANHGTIDSAVEQVGEPLVDMDPVLLLRGIPQWPNPENSQGLPENPYVNQKTDHPENLGDRHKRTRINQAATANEISRNYGSMNYRILQSMSHQSTPRRTSTAQPKSPAETYRNGQINQSRRSRKESMDALTDQSEPPLVRVPRAAEGVWSKWTPWLCDKVCDGKHGSRTRICMTKPTESEDANNRTPSCPGEAKQRTDQCNGFPCPDASSGGFVPAHVTGMIDTNMKLQHNDYKVSVI